MCTRSSSRFLFNDRLAPLKPPSRIQISSTISSGKINVSRDPEHILMSSRPELREFLILNSQQDPSNKIAAAFASNVRFMWPYDLCDTWTRNRHTGVFSFSKLFTERFNDIRSWALAPEFFDLYPELIGYVPSYDPSRDLTIGNGMRSQSQS
jgi:hypothetical protein